MTKKTSAVKTRGTTGSTPEKQAANVATSLPASLTPKAAKKPAAGAGRAASGKKPARPRSHRRLARAIFKEHNMVTIGRELLESKSATVKARVWETLVNYELGEFAKPKGDPPAREIIWDSPRPVRAQQ